MRHDARRRGWRWVRRMAFGAALFVLGVVLLVTFVPLGGSVKVQAAKLVSSNSTARSSSSSHSGGARLQMRRIGVVNASDHPLMRRIVPIVTERLAEVAGVEQVAEVKGETWTMDDGGLFDVIVLLDMPRHEESGMAVTGRELKAVITADVGPWPWGSSHSYMDHLSPPVIEVHMHVELDHTSTTTGYESADARGSLAAADIAEELASQLGKPLAEYAGGNGVMPELPAAFYGTRAEPSQELPLPDSLPGARLRRLYSGPRLMVHNETVWTMEVEAEGDQGRGREAREVLAKLQEDLVTGGWRVDTKLRDEAGSPPHFRASRGPTIVEAFGPRPHGGSLRAEPERVVIVLRERFSEKEISAAAGELFDAGASLSQLHIFSRWLSDAQQDAMAERVIEEGTRDAELLLSVARYHERQGQKEAALATLNRAAVLAVGHEDASKLRKRIEEAGRKITGDEKWEPAKPDEAMLRAAGFQLLPDPGAGEATAEVGLEEPAHFYEAGDELKFHSIIVEPSAIPEGVYTLIHRTGQVDSGGASSTSATVHSLARPWRSGTSFHSDGKAVNVDAEEIGEERFRVTVRVGAQ